MLEVVDELERNGHNLQHFSRELARYFRNLLVARISGADTRLVAASAAERQKLAEIASQFSEEDLSVTCSSRSICSAICNSPCNRASTWNRPGPPGASRPPAAHRRSAGAVRWGRSATCPKQYPPPPPPPRIGPSPFDLDRAKKAAPAPTGDPRERLHSYLHEKGLTHLADAVENARITVSGSDLNVVAPKSYASISTTAPWPMPRAKSSAGPCA